MVGLSAAALARRVASSRRIGKGRQGSLGEDVGQASGEHGEVGRASHEGQSGSVGRGVLVTAAGSVVSE